MSQLSAAAFQAYDPTQAGTITPGPLALYTVQVNTIDPTQLNEGFSEVGKKAAGDDLLSPAQLQASLLTAIEPVVIGPGGQLYLTDGHHTFTALEDSIYGASNPIVYVNVIANYANLTTSQFFAQMQASNFLLPLNDGVPQIVNDSTGAPIPTSLTGLTSDPYRGLEYSILKNKSSKLFTTTSNITNAIGSSTPGLDKMTGFYSDFLEAAAYRNANGGLGLPYLSPGDIALAAQWNLNGASTFTLPNIAGPVTAAQLPGFILAQNLVQGGTIASTVISNATLANGALDGNGTFTGITTINAGTAANPITIGTPNTGFIMQVGNDKGFTVTLNGANTYTGGTSVLAGTLIITSDAALGAAVPTGATIDTTNLKASVQAANGIVFNSLTEGNGTLLIGTTSGAGTAAFSTNRSIAISGEAATINLNGYLVSLTGQLYSLGTAGVGIGNATGFSDLTIDDNGSNKGVLTLSTASPNFYGNIIIGNANKPTVRVMSDAALGNTTGNANAIGQIELNGGTLQAGASFSATERNIFLGGGSTIDTAGFTTSWGTLSDTQRVLTITNSNASTPGTVSFSSFNISTLASLVLSGNNTVTFTNGIQRAGTAALIVQPANSTALGTTEKLMSAGSSTNVVDGIAPAWIVTNNGTSSSAGPYDFVTYGANGYVKATYAATALTASTGSSAVALSANTTATGNVAACALNTEGKTIALGANTLSIGDGTAADAAGLILASGTTISGGTLAFGSSEGLVWMGGSAASTSISSTITGSNGLTFSGSGGVTLNAAANVSGLVTLNGGTLTLGAVNVFATDTSGLQLQDTKSTPAKATLAVNASNSLSALNSAGNNSAITIATGTVLTIGDGTNQNSTISSTITGSGTAAIVKAGSGLLDLSGGKVTSIGTISATGGVLRVAVGTSATANYTLSNGADLQFAQNGGGQYSGAISGAGTLHLIGGTLELTGTANTYSGGTIVETGSILDVTTANLPTINENITDAGGLVVFDQATTGIFTGVISDGKELGTGPAFSGSLDKDDSTGGNGGAVTLAAVQAYTGATSVEAGTLTLGVTNAVAASSGVALGRIGGGATATLALGADNALAALTNNASNTTSVQLNGFALTLAPIALMSATFGGTIVDGSASGRLIKSGAGTFVLSGANTYTGGTTLTSGTLELASQGAAGIVVGGNMASGGIAFSGNAATLQIDVTALTGSSYAAPITGFTFGTTLDLRGLTYAADDQATLSGGSLTVGDATATEVVTNFVTASGVSAAYDGFATASDGFGGTDVTLIVKAPAAPTLAAGQDTGLSPSDNDTKINKPILTGSAVPGGTVTLYDGTAPIGSAVVGGNGIYDVAPSSALTDGVHTLSVTVTDTAANTSAASSGLAVTIDTTPPTFTGLAEAPSSGSVGLGQMVVLTLTPSEAVSVAGTPTLTLNDGGTATYDAGKSTATALAFDYVVSAGDTNVPVLKPTTFNLPKGAAVADLAGNAANLSLANLAQAGGIGNQPAGGVQVDNVPPTLISVSETPSAGLLQTGDTDVLTLGLSKAVRVAGTPTLALNDGGTATYDAGKSTATALAFDYRVGQTDQPVAALAVTSVSLTNGATITDAAGNAATLSLAGLSQSGPQVVPNLSLFGSISHDVSSEGGDIYALYQTILGHAPGATEIEAGVAALDSGASLKSVAQELLASGEYTQHYGRASAQPRSGFVDLMFVNAMDRHATAAELKTWDQQLAAGTPRARVAVEIAGLPETHADLAPAFQAGVFVPSPTDSGIARLYYALLGHAPDAAGLASFEASGASLKTVARDLIHSSDYASLHGSPGNSGFVESLFEGAFGHGAGGTSAEPYLHSLNSGASRATVAVSIAQSAEAIAHLNANIETGFHLA